MDEISTKVTNPGSTSDSWRALCNEFDESLKATGWQEMTIGRQKEFFGMIAEKARTDPEQYRKEFGQIVGAIINEWVYAKARAALKGEGGRPRTEEVASEVMEDIMYDHVSIAKYAPEVAAPSTFLQELVENKTKSVLLNGNSVEYTNKVRGEELETVIEFLKRHDAPLISPSLLYCICEAKRPSAYSYSNVAELFVNPDGGKSSQLNESAADPKNDFVETEGTVAVNDFFRATENKYGEKYTNAVKWLAVRMEEGGPRPGEEREFESAKKLARILRNEPSLLRMIGAAHLAERGRKRYSVTDNSGRMSADEIERIANIEM